MALVDNSPFTPNIRGKIGGTSFSNSIAGRVIKNGGKRTNSLSFQNSTNKNLVAQLSNYWRNMSVADRLSWSSFAQFKPTSQRRNLGRFINGQQMFILYNSAYYRFFTTYLNAPSFFTYNFPQYIANLTNSGGALTFNVGQNIDEVNTICLLKMSAPCSPSRNSPQGGYKYIYCVFGNTPVTDITVLYTYLFGMLPPVGSAVFVEFRVFAVANTDFTNIYKFKCIVQP